MTYAQQTMDLIKSKKNDESIDKGIRIALGVVEEHLTVVVSGRMTRAAGKASCKLKNYSYGREAILSSLKITYSRELMARDTEEGRIDTITHELAHIIEYVIRGDSDHGYNWQRIHRALGGSAKRTHNIDRTGLHREVKRFFMRDTKTGREMNLTHGNYKKALSWGSRYKLLEIRFYKGNELTRTQRVVA